MKRSVWISIALLLVVLASSLVWPAAAWLNSKDIDYEAVEKAWETGDMDEELKPEVDLMHKRRQAEERQKRPNFVGDVGIPQTMLILFKDSALPDFVRLYPEIPDPTHAIAEMWKSMLFNGGIEAEFFELNETPDKLLVKVQRGWLAEDLVDFLVNQEQVKEVLWDYETYYPPGTDEAAMEKEKERLRQEAMAKEKLKQKKRKKKTAKTEL
ncbi:hypothetical protein SPRG_15170 [Saprolegnia parasitica CBS 223.65]|uniref:Uncharacterized protein n=1 Tax=Saprolegnia parasitica (strain CBS 223.65) TaxID=695850 RepID=A0A067BVY5_SAPPC|nr:hypothetical protein SPRG_15170 [Saprolegnia parasitica CBS 223.65]KDO18461.1 hypothetical protein SPRG_15170 [Saprolegnia parasitica CBS 223.65]|eukprot:XP_012210839.1 hypothetical protein SPRG_15170 [Saprolegnia parasitica CBS 223.65]